MRTIPEAEFKKISSIVARLEDTYNQWRPFHRELAEFILPMRYSWLADTAPGIAVPIRTKIDTNRNKQILDSTGTKAARDLAAGMLNGITSPARPWFNLRPAGFAEDGIVPVPLAKWLEEIRRRMFLVMAESNFYNSMAMLLLDLVVFGTAGMLIYEDFNDVIRCYNQPVGEFRLAQDNRRDISVCSRSLVLDVSQVVSEFGEDAVTPYTARKFRQGGAEHFHSIRVFHLIEPNADDARFLPGGFAYREFYWEGANNPERKLLRAAGFTEKPGGWPRWEVVGNETYGLSPGMDALPDIIQLQHETVRKAEALDKMTDPPVVLDSILRTQRGAVNPGTKLYVPSHSQANARALYTVAMPLGELTADIVAVQTRIRETFFNDLFRMISMLQTVRSATEIDARREEKLVLMGAILERLENEALDPFIIRIFGIMKRKGLIPDPPPEYGEVDIQVQYVSILSDAQRAVGTGVIERFMQVIGETSALIPEVKDLVNWPAMLREYGTRLNVPAAGLRSEEELAAISEKNAELQAAQQAALVGTELTNAAKNLGTVDVGGGQNAFQALLASG